MPISVKTPPSLSTLAPALRGLVRSTLHAQGRSDGEIGVVLADDALLRELNRDYRGLDKATDVLSFAYDESGEGLAPETARDPNHPVNGDLIVSMDRVREQAARFRVHEGEELARLVVHGTLHLAGLDHHHDAERKHMRSREDTALVAGSVPVRSLVHALDRIAARRTPHPAPRPLPKPSELARAAAKKAAGAKRGAKKPAAKRTAAKPKPAAGRAPARTSRRGA